MHVETADFGPPFFFGAGIVVAFRKKGYPETMSQSVNELVASATRASNAGRVPEAERLWKKVLQRAPKHPQALCALGLHALQSGNVDKARKRLEAAREAAPQDLYILMTLADACRRQGDATAERDAIEAALAVDAYCVPALLARGNWIERHGKASLAATVYANALKISPPEAEWPPAWRAQLEHARQFAERQSMAFDAFLNGELAALTAALPRASAARWAEAMAIRARRSAPYLSESNQLHIPRLPAIPFFDRAGFPFLATLEDNTDLIRDELQRALQADRDRFQPYIAYRPGDPVNQWRELDHSERWSAFHLWRNGEAVSENLERCPQTAALLADVALCDLDGLCPNVFFSALAPKTKIPPHNGESNARVIGHLPLIVPEGCRLRVGFDVREWEVGKALVFDDTLEHEAWNDSDELRVVLIFDLWNPLLDDTDRVLANALAVATRNYSGD